MLNSAIGGGNPGCLIKPTTLVLLTPSTAINSVSPSTGGSLRLATPGRSGSMTRHLRDRVASGPPAAAYCTTCLLYTSDAADEEDSVDLGGRRIIKKKKKKKKYT